MLANSIILLIVSSSIWITWIGFKSSKVINLKMLSFKFYSLLPVRIPLIYWWLACLIGGEYTFPSVGNSLYISVLLLVLMEHNYTVSSLSSSILTILIESGIFILYSKKLSEFYRIFIQIYPNLSKFVE